MKAKKLFPDITFKKLLNKQVDMMYPVGSIYMSVNDTSPTTLFGGTWEQIKDTFLLSAGDTYAGGSVGGEATHTHEISAGKAWATIGNHSDTICFAADIGGQQWKDWTQSTPYYWTHTADAPLTSDHEKYELGSWTNVYGETDAHNNMPPYLAVFVWKRTA